MNTHNHDAARPTTIRAILIASLAAVAVFLGLGLFALTRPLRHAVSGKVPYTQAISLSYSARAPTGPVYPGGVLNTGDPIFLRLVHRVQVRLEYRLSIRSPHKLAGIATVGLRLSGPAGWSTNIPIAAPQHFTGDRAIAHVTLDLNQLQSLLGRVQALTGFPAGAGFTVAVVPAVRVGGTVLGQPFNTRFNPVMSFQLDPVELVPGGGSTRSGAPAAGLTPSAAGTVATATSVSNTVSVAGLALGVAILRWIALAGFLLAAVAVFLAVLLKRRQPSDPSALIQAEYGNLIVPITNAIDDPTRPPIDVANIKALVQLAQCSERLILHHRDNGTDTYLVDDEGALYRYRVQTTSRHQPFAPSGRSARRNPPASHDSPPGKSEAHVRQTASDAPIASDLPAPREASGSPDPPEPREAPGSPDPPEPRAAPGSPDPPEPRAAPGSPDPPEPPEPSDAPAAVAPPARQSRTAWADRWDLPERPAANERRAPPEAAQPPEPLEPPEPPEAAEPPERPDTAETPVAAAGPDGAGDGRRSAAAAAVLAAATRVRVAAEAHQPPAAPDLAARQPDLPKLQPDLPKLQRDLPGSLDSPAQPELSGLPDLPDLWEPPEGPTPDIPLSLPVRTQHGLTESGVQTPDGSAEDRGHGLRGGGAVTHRWVVRRRRHR